MLYDPKWETKVDPLSLAGLIAWLEKQPAEKTYDWNNCQGECLIDQYGAAIGRSFDDSPISASGRDLMRIFGNSCGYRQVCSSHSGPTTFGAALDRARKLVA